MLVVFVTILVMYIFDTLTKSKKEFIPLEEGKVSFYHCGPTVYWTQQIGNMFAMVMADLIHRSFTYLNYEVTMVRNYTDVGHLSGDNDGDADTGIDRMEKAAKRDKKTPAEIAKYYTDEFNQHTSSLNIIIPTHTPAATEYIQEMISMVQELLEKGFAYQTELAIYFNVSKKDDYTKLSGQKLDKLQSGTGHGDVTDPEKRSHHDFSIWFFKKGSHEHALQTWQNPFSVTEGFPGWHIECSAMIKSLLGNTIDLHMGGIEHIPTHHTNEIAQSESANDAVLANYWIHNEHLLVDGKKMGKSAGNAYNLHDVIERGYEPLDLRYFFLQAHYRSKQNFTWDALDASRTARTRLLSKMASLPNSGSVNTNYKKEFSDALEADFGLPEALSVVYKVLSSDLSDADKKSTILDFDRVLGLDLDKAQENDESLSLVDVSEEILKILNNRAEARENKNWDESDKLRDVLDSQGYVVKDTEGGQELYKK